MNERGGGAGGVGQGRITLQVIADRLDVSTATVSLALRDSPVVADATRQRVRSLARELGYIYNRSAASLRTARTNMVAVGFHDITNPYFAELLSAIEDAVIDAGKTILLGTYGESLERQDRVLGSLREYRPDGMILCAAGGTTATTVEPILAARIPVVQLSRAIAGVDLDFIGSDDRTGAILAVEHLHALGHRRIAMLGGTDLISTGARRREGYREGLRRTGLPLDEALVIEGLGNRETGARGVMALLDLPDPPSAAVCFNDLIAFGALLGLRHRGLEAGADFSVVGCDDVQEAALWYPALTTIHNRQDEMGRGAAHMLVQRIADPGSPSRSTLLTPRLVVRGSTAPPRPR